MTAEKYIGLDVHQATISLAVMDSKGKVVMESILETKATTILEFLAKIDKVMLQTHLNDLAKTLSHARVQHARFYFKAIFEEAIEQDLVQKNPARKLILPNGLRAPDKTTLSWDQLRLVRRR